MKVTYIHHSSFLVETDENYFLFYNLPVHAAKQLNILDKITKLNIKAAVKHTRICLNKTFISAKC